MASTKPRKAGDGSRAKRGTSIPKGDALLQGVIAEDLQKMHAELSGRKEASKEALILAAAIKWREGLGVSEVAEQMLQPRSTVCDWLARLRNRGLDGISDRTAPNYQPIPGKVACLVIGVWLSHAPQAYGPESGLWQASMLRRMILGRLEMDIKPRTQDNTTQDESPIPDAQEGAAQIRSPETCKKFIENTQKRLDARPGWGTSTFTRTR